MFLHTKFKVLVKDYKISKPKFPKYSPKTEHTLLLNQKKKIKDSFSSRIMKVVAKDVIILEFLIFHAAVIKLNIALKNAYKKTKVIIPKVALMLKNCNLIKRLT